MIALYHDLSDWVIGFAESDWAILLLGLNSFVEAIFFPVPPDPMLVAVALAQPDIAIWLGALTAASSVAGAVVGHWLGTRLGRPLLLRMFSEDRVGYVESLSSATARGRRSSPRSPRSRTRCSRSRPARCGWT